MKLDRLGGRRRLDKMYVKGAREKGEERQQEGRTLGESRTENKNKRRIRRDMTEVQKRKGKK